MGTDQKKEFVAMKDTAVALLAILLLCISASHSRASWLIDAERYHTSVHGQLSCQDCHETIAAEGNHPDPLNVNRSIDDFFSPDKCFQCHDDVDDEIESGGHGGKDVTAWQQFNNCIACHNPHEQLSSYADVGPGDVDQPGGKKCSLCHDLRQTLPEMPTEDQDCMTCHNQVLPGDPTASQKIAVLCFACHATDGKNARHPYAEQPLINTADYASTPHAAQSCLTCHPQAAGFRHDQQEIGDCRTCHVPHDAKVTRDAHSIVSCGACHLKGIKPFKDAQTGKILWQKTGSHGRTRQIHNMLLPDVETSCASCHFKNNTVGAAAMLLPAKSVICMPCHTATFSVGDTTTMLSLIIFMVGFMGVASIWFSGKTRNDKVDSNLSAKFKAIVRFLFSRRFVAMLSALMMDGLLQRRLYRSSPGRWILHALVFYSIVFRFVWGFSGLILSLWWPASSVTGMMMDKNHPVTAFLFDLSGFLVIAGVAGMMVRRIQGNFEQKVRGYPPSDWLAYGLLGGIMLVGFILEGMRMAMTGSPGGASWAFVGDLISRWLYNVELTGIYGYIWYLHAVLTGVFVAYLPFSRMFHMIMAPVVLAVNAASSTHKQN